MKKNVLFLLLLSFSNLLYSEDKIEQPMHAVNISGEENFSKSELYDAMSVTHKSFFQFWKKDNPRINDKLIPTLSQSLRSFYDSEGFYDAKYSITETNSSIAVKVTENKPVKVNDINITSNYDLKDIVEFKKGEIFKTKKFIVTKSKIIDQMLKDGYCSYNLDTKAYVDLKKHTVDLVYQLDKGGICKFGKMSVRGLETVEKDVIQSRVRALEGEDFSLDRIKETSESLYALHAFDSVVIDTDRKFYNVVPLDIKVAEMKKPYHYEIGAGFDTYVGPRIHGEIIKNNFLGNAKQLKLKALWSPREQLLVLEFFKPVLFQVGDYAVDYGTGVGFSNLEFDGFKENKVFLDNYFSHETARSKLKIGFMLENINISKLDNLNGNDLTQAVNEGNFILTYPYIDFVYDARDSKMNPKNGFYIASYLELGMSSDEESSMYYKSLTELRLIHTFSKLTLAAVGKVGILDVEDPKGLPESKYFFGGGAYSNRAYGFKELGVITSPTKDTINGASTWTNLLVEADYPVWGDLYLALFNDNTMLTEDAYDFNGEIISSAGMGVRYMTPIGPFKLDVGFNVADPSQYNILFQIGQSF